MVIARKVQLACRKTRTNRGGVDYIHGVRNGNETGANQRATQQLNRLGRRPTTTGLGGQATPVEQRQTGKLLVEVIPQGVGLHLHRAEVDEVKIDGSGSECCRAAGLLKESLVDEKGRGARAAGHVAIEGVNKGRAEQIREPRAVGSCNVAQAPDGRPRIHQLAAVQRHPSVNADAAVRGDERSGDGAAGQGEQSGDRPGAGPAELSRAKIQGPDGPRTVVKDGAARTADAHRCGGNIAGRSQRYGASGRVQS